MKGPDTRGRVLAKTGTLAEVTALAGYVDNRHDRRRYAFAIVLNGVRDIAGGRRLEDRIVEALAGPWNVPDVKAPP
jgi:D-alanyl-D-alanine carboxypeptidase/D-alanyl-D-alanine-endopeptidase (penicillin-binding protein 4)